MTEDKETQDAQDIPNKEAGTENPSETLKPTYEELETEKDRKEAEIQRLHGVIKANQRQSITRNDFNTLAKQMNDNVLFQAKMLDNVVSQMGEGYSSTSEQPNIQKKTFESQAQERIEEASKPQQLDPEGQAFVNYMTSQGLDFDSPLVQEAIGEKDNEDRSPKEALTHLKTKVDETRKAEMKGEAEAIAQTIFEQKVKDMGLAGAGATAPSGSAGDLSSLSADEKLQRGFAEIDKKK